MKVLYGAPIPPGLTSPTRGEVRIRIERLVLQERMLPPEIPHDECAVECQWWGESSPSSGHEVPSTSTSARGVTTFVYPVKTLRPQLEEYFSHMAGAKAGLQVKVFAPATVTGKKQHLPVGVAMINVESLSPRPPIHGWFTVVSVLDETQCIGRVKLSVAVTYFNKTQRERASSEERAAASGASEGEGEDEERRSRTPTPTPATTTTEQQQSQPQDSSHDERPLPKRSEGAADTAGAVAPTSPGRSSEESIQRARERQQAQQTSQCLDDILQRGLGLRERMLAAQDLEQQTAANLPQHQRQYSGLPLPAISQGWAGRVPTAEGGGFHQPTSAHQQQQRGAGATGTAEPVGYFYPEPYSGQRIHDELSSDSGDEYSDELSSYVESTDDEEDRNDYLANRGKVSNPQELTHSYHGLHRVYVELSSLSFKKIVSEVRFKLRPSSDISFIQPIAQLVSPIYQIPWTGSVPFELCAASFSSQSRLVLECYDIRSRYDPKADANIFLAEKLIGVVVIGLYNQQQDYVSFHNPISGEDPVQCRVSLSVQQAITEEDRSTLVSIAQTIAKQQSALEKEPMTLNRGQQSHRETQTITTAEESQTTARQEGGHHGGKTKKGKKHAADSTKPKQAPRSGKPLHHVPEGKIKSNTTTTAGGAGGATAADLAPHEQEEVGQQEVADDRPAQFLLELSVTEIKGLPLVASADAPNERCQPSTFVAVEDLFVAPPEAKKSITPTGGAAAVSRWRCDEDRSDIVLDCQEPHHRFFTEIAVPSLEPQFPPLESATQALKNLRALSLSVWHYGPASTAESQPADGESVLVAGSSARRGGAPSPPLVVPIRSAVKEDEEAFWDACHMLGNLQVDLSSVRFFPCRSGSDSGVMEEGESATTAYEIGGWYHIYDAQDEVLATTIGQAKISVKYIPLTAS